MTRENHDTHVHFALHMWLFITHISLKEKNCSELKISTKFHFSIFSSYSVNCKEKEQEKFLTTEETRQKSLKSFSPHYWNLMEKLGYKKWRQNFPTDTANEERNCFNVTFLEPFLLLSFAVRSFFQCFSCEDFEMKLKDQEQVRQK